MTYSFDLTHVQNLKEKKKRVEKEIIFGVTRAGGQEDREMKKLVSKYRLPVIR